MIMIPLVLLSIVLGVWRHVNDRIIAVELFDRSLLTAAIAISLDASIQAGDAISPAIRGLIADATGGEIFYHVSDFGGVHLTGYAYPPVDLEYMKLQSGEPTFLHAHYRDKEVRVVALKSKLQADGRVGETTVTVWQNIDERQTLLLHQAIRTFSLLFLLMLVLGVVVWFSVRRGLRPLVKLEREISTRSPDDLGMIEQRVPRELDGIVGRLNHLFKVIETSIRAQQNFISDAAHQLRNPANAVNSLVGALQDAKTDDDRNERIKELSNAAKVSVRLTQQLLSLGRLDALIHQPDLTVSDLNELVVSVCHDIAPQVLQHELDFEYIQHPEPLQVEIDEVFTAEAIRNMIDNSQQHGGPSLTKIQVETHVEPHFACLTISDDGKGLTPEDSEKAFSRFGQVEPSSGSGLGLAIAASVAQSHGGSIQINRVENGSSITLRFPLVEFGKEE